MLIFNNVNLTLKYHYLSAKYYFDLIENNVKLISELSFCLQDFVFCVW